ncbi:hypothetical protein [Edaphocola flava]|uniref:hypothetical protein n=1 Tax=Edaphocola flava TaxID=2499629 RepID=UPI00100B77B9|nr:hypothetical protein [Edaphocola flava]
MKNSYIFLLCCLLHTHVWSQKTNMVTKEKQLAALYSKIDGNRYSANSDNKAEMFARQMNDFIRDNPATLSYTFTKLQKSGVHIATSPDGNFRIYSWDTWTGGSMHFFQSIYQWKDGGQIYYRMPQYGEGDPGSFSSQIYMVDIGKYRYYLSVENMILSTMHRGQMVMAHRIAGNKLIDTDKIFRAKTQKLKVIDIYFNVSSLDETRKWTTDLITYDYRYKLLYIPLVTKDNVTYRNLLYQLKGNYFEYIGIETGKRK